MVARIAHVHSKDVDRKALTRHETDLEFQAGTRHIENSVPVSNSGGLPPRG